MLFVHVGSFNPQKVAAVREAFLDVTPGDHFDWCEAPSGVRAQPHGLDEMVEGARNRAIAAVVPMPKDAAVHLGVGLESGLIGPQEKFRDIRASMACCAICRSNEDGSPPSRWIYGFSSAFTIPSRIMHHVKLGLELSQAARQAGYTTHEKIGHAEGIISLLSGGRIDRKGQLKEAVRNALFGLDTLL